jgi:hypothetical protein
VGMGVVALKRCKKTKRGQEEEWRRKRRMGDDEEDECVCVCVCACVRVHVCMCACVCARLSMVARESMVWLCWVPQRRACKAHQRGNNLIKRAQLVTELFCVRPFQIPLKPLAPGDAIVEVSAAQVCHDATCPILPLGAVLWECLLGQNVGRCCGLLVSWVHRCGGPTRCRVRVCSLFAQLA